LGSERYEAGREVLTDAQTRLANRLHFDVVYRIVFAAGTRGFPISVLLMDIPLADASDDAAVAALGEKLLSFTRDMDLVARLDESRFVALLLGCNVHGGRIAADRILEFMAPWLQSVGTTMNVGVAAYTQEMEAPGHLMAAAEAALRHALETPGPSVET
jgi:GGDEF domain-containing protein